jgi:hypothetical protein
VARLFEARRPKDNAIIAEITETWSSAGLQEQAAHFHQAGTTKRRSEGSI